MAGVKLNNVIKKYGEAQVVHGVDLTVEDGEFCVFVGPSGCGKSTLLRMIAGLEETTSGTISIGERDVTTAAPADRGVAMVFQTYALYPHMTVEENMGFGLKMNGVDKSIIKEKVDEAAGILQLGDYLKRRPKALSGGQRQRVAIGRAIVRGPDVFLFDEPLSNLDAELRVEMRAELARLHQSLDSTMIYVTHDQVEAMTLADKIVVLRAGQIEQVGSPMELYSNPNNKFVAGFIGSPGMNFLPAELSQNSLALPAIGHDTVPVVLESKTADKLSVWAGIRPQSVRINPEGNVLKVDLIENLGGVSYVYLITDDGHRLIAELSQDETLPRIGDKVGIDFDPSRVMLFDQRSDARIR
ncbi:ABC transporter ATP-binding protein [Maritalea mediterranea]|uniref:Sn-glycerol-3-phosphate ABC transporter ATP-binding protein UgpC n=1 Tax=Maritalea mediterranea TaxID=2909667 RepID=A0ABS9E7H4_9HYPH|nr:sn-glycerol-3-phosphate ABC transporter ATP-binding protein UgpC [Maritalea mediterranea]MCF4098124.1 sn-glycerol-3-phosphate ABC transporter ATP-binding protein UgpC [Maritalea mediterranea]